MSAPPLNEEEPPKSPACYHCEHAGELLYTGWYAAGDPLRYCQGWQCPECGKSTFRLPKREDFPSLSYASN